MLSRLWSALVHFFTHQHDYTEQIESHVVDDFTGDAHVVTAKLCRCGDTIVTSTRLIYALVLAVAFAPVTSSAKDCTINPLDYPTAPAYTRSAELQGMAEFAATQIVKRLSDGTPSANGKICALDFGMSSEVRVGTAIKQQFKNAWKPRLQPSVTVVYAAASGKTVRYWDDEDEANTPSRWPTAISLLANAGCSPEQVGFVFGMVAQEQPATDGIMTAVDLDNVQAAVVAEFQYAKILEFRGHPFTGYLEIPGPFATKVPEPTIHANHVLLADWVEANRDTAPIVTTYRQSWSQGTVTNPHMGAPGLSLSWVCTDVEDDGHHPQPSTPSIAIGAVKLAVLLLNQWAADPSMWWLVQ
jgi:hypothetical protein